MNPSAVRDRSLPFQDLQFMAHRHFTLPSQARDSASARRVHQYIMEIAVSG